jgi:hypothetical protein
MAGGMMTLAQQLRQKLRAFVNGEIDESALALWLAGVGRTIDKETADVRTLWEDASALLAEVTGVNHDPQDVRLDLADLLESDLNAASAPGNARAV